MALFPLVLLLLVGWSIVALTRSATVPAAALADIAGTGADRVLFERFFERSRRFRFAGAIAGWMIALLVTTIMATDDGHSDGATLDLTFVASLALGGSVAGSVLAEAFRLRRPRSARTASLAVRAPERYADPLAARRESAVAIASGLAIGLAVLTGEHVGPVCALVGLVLALVVLRRWSTHRIAHRARPAMGAELADADDRIRSLAASVGLGRPVVTLEAIVVSWQYRQLAATESVFAFATVTALITAFVWWHQNRSFGLIERARSRGTVPSATRSGLIAAGSFVLITGLILGLVVAVRGGP